VEADAFVRQVFHVVTAAVVRPVFPCGDSHLRLSREAKRATSSPTSMSSRGASAARAEGPYDPQHGEWDYPNCIPSHRRVHFSDLAPGGIDPLLGVLSLLALF